MFDNMVKTIINYCENSLSYEDVVNERTEEVNYELIVKVVFDKFCSILEEIVE